MSIETADAEGTHLEGVQAGGGDKTALNISFLSSTYAILMNSPMNILLVAIFPCLVCYYAGAAEYLTFIFAVLALAPLAERLSFTTEQLCLHTNDTIAGLLNVTFGNATELIVGIMALKYGLKRLIQLSLLGSVLSNSLLVLGSSFVVSGFQFKAVRFNAHLGHVTAVQMILAMTSVLIGSVGYASSESSYLLELGYSRALSFGLLFVYAGFVYFQLISHTKYYNVKEATGSTRWKDPIASNYSGLSIDEQQKPLSYKPVPILTENDGTQIDSHLDEIENEELVRRVQLESAALHPDLHHHHGHGHSRSHFHRHSQETTSSVDGKDLHLEQSITKHSDEENKAIDESHGAVDGHDADDESDGEDEDDEEDQLGFMNALIWLGIITVIISLVSNALADTIEDAAVKLGISSNFLATIVLPILGNAAEHASAIIFGYKGKATLAMAIAVGSSIQIALFVYPLLILLGWMIHLDVDFDMGAFEAMTMVIATILPNVVLNVMKTSSTGIDGGKVLTGETTYFSGVILVATYFLIAVGFYARNQESLDS